MSLTKINYSQIKGAPVSVLDYGATGDGVTDDTASINTAIAAFTSGGMLFFPKGTYLLSTALLTQGKNIWLKGEGKGETILKQSGVGLNIHGIQFSGATSKYLYVSDLSIDPSVAHTADHSQCAIRADLSEILGGESDCEIHIRDVSSTGWNNGVYITGIYATSVKVAVASVRDCDIQTQGANSSSISDPISIHNTKLVLIENNILDNASLGDHCVYAIQNADVRVRDNRMSNSIGGAVKLITTAAASGQSPVSWEVTGNHFNSCNQSGTLTVDTYTLPHLCWTDNVETTGGGGGSDNCQVLVTLQNSATLRSAVLDRNSFTDLQKGAIKVTIGAGSLLERFSAANLNVYNWGIASAGTHYAVTDSGGTGGRLAIVGGYFNGNSNGRQTFNLSSFDSVYKAPTYEKLVTTAVYQGGGVPIGLTTTIKSPSVSLYQNANVNAATSIATTEETLGSYTLAANALAAVGQSVRIKAWGACAANANTKTIKLKIDANNLQQNNVTTAPNGVGWIVEAVIFMTASSFVATSASMSVGSALQLPVSSVSTASANTASRTIAITGQNGSVSAGDITLQGWFIEYLP